MDERRGAICAVLFLALDIAWRGGEGLGGVVAGAV
jgi:hypothetical protein